MLLGCVCFFATTTGKISMKLSGRKGNMPRKNPLNLNVELNKGENPLILIMHAVSYPPFSLLLNLYHNLIIQI